MILASFNIFWLGTRDTTILTRRADDEALLGRVLAWINADVLVLQEIVDLELLERLLPPGFRVRIPGPDGSARWLCPTHPHHPHFATLQKIVVAVGPGVEVLRVETFPAHWPGPRPPLVITLRRGDVELTVVGVHLKSGEIEGGPGEGPSGTRSREAAALGAWLADKPRTVVAGDFNARAGAPSLSALLPAGWSWPTIRSPAPPEAWTTWIDRAVIDQIVPSPDLQVDPAEILPFDLDPAFSDAQLRVRSGFEAARLAGMPLAEVENLYRVSDHRPLRAVIRG